MISMDSTSLVVVFSSFTIGFTAAYMLKGNLKGVFFKAKSSTDLRSSGVVKMALVVRTDLKMGKGKAAAQCAHAALSGYRIAQSQASNYVRQWEEQGQTKVVVRTQKEEGLMALANASIERGLVTTVIHDAGHTQVKSGTATVCAIGPGPEHLVSQVIGNLKLY